MNPLVCLFVGWSWLVHRLIGRSAIPYFPKVKVTIPCFWQTTFFLAFFSFKLPSFKDLSCKVLKTAQSTHGRLLSGRSSTIIYRTVKFNFRFFLSEINSLYISKTRHTFSTKSPENNKKKNFRR